MKHLIVIMALLALNTSCKASILNLSLKGFSKSIAQRSLSTVYQIHDRFILDPLSKEDKTCMNRFNKFMKNGFAPDFKQEHVEEFYQRYNTKSLMDVDGLKLIKYKYFRKIFPKHLDSVLDMFAESCPEFPDSLALPIDYSIFIKKDSHPNLMQEQLIRCGHFLTDIKNMYSYAYRNNVPILYAPEKAALLERFLVIFFTRFDVQSDFQVDQNINESLDELSKGMYGLTLPHFYTHPSDPYSFYVHQVAGLIFIELEKYRK